MVAISLMIEGQNGLTWPRWKKLVAEAEQLGFAGLFRSDHFTNAKPPDMDSLEMIVSLTYLADHSQRLHFGPLVAPVSFRNPMLLARQAAALDDLSNGRMILGLGAGWQEREHTLFGYDLGDTRTKMSRLQEALEVITRLLNSDEPVTFEGHYYQLRGATLLPRPQRRGGPEILIGGGGVKWSLPLVVRYATQWNVAYLAPDAFRERAATLDKMLQAAGRKPSDVKKSVMLTLYSGQTMEEVDARLNMRHNDPELADKPLDAVIEHLSTTGSAIVGTPDQMVQQIQAYGNAGAAELMLQWFDLDDIEGLRSFAQSVLPRLANS